MFKFKNVIIDNDRLSVDCLINYKESESYHIELDAKTFDLISCPDNIPYASKIVSVIKNKYLKEGTLPREFLYATH